MAIDDRLMSLVAAFTHGDENTISLYDPLWAAEGGIIETDQLADFIDELEGEFGIVLREREVEHLASLEELLNLVEGRMESGR